MTQLEQDIKTWADDRFGHRTTTGRIRKLGEEFGELAEAVAEADRTKIIEEAADVGMVVSDMLALIGVSFSEAMATKLEANKKRSATYKELKK
jgi:NTP pyrophosphatase (non-canonical NTP hydrolase)